MDKENSRNTILFVVLAMGMLLLYQVFVMGPAQKRQEVAAAAARAQAAATALNPLAPGAFGSSPFVSREQAMAASPRSGIDTPALSGSVALKGARIDDLYLKLYPETLAKGSPPVELFRPEGAQQAYFADFGWAGRAASPTTTTLWKQTAGDRLTPGHPITLSWDNGQGLTFNRSFAVDAQYMFTVTDTVINRGGAAVQLAPYASVQRQGMPVLSQTAIIHEGGIGSESGQLKLWPFKKWKEKGLDTQTTTGGWLGLTDKYWLAAVIPDQSKPVTGSFRVSAVNGVDVYEANYVGGPANLGPGQQASVTHHLFAGAKKVSILKEYQTALNLPRFDDAVDWGHLWFLTKPVFMLLAFFASHVANFGIAILLLTVAIKAVMFPLANKQFASMSEMKKLQPKMEELKKKYKDDPAKQQQETMELYKREKINPMAGCLPVLVTIPVFYSLYKVLFVTIEMRHAPFFGWIKDLSAPDPTTFINLFGLLPFDPASLPGIGSFFTGVGFAHIGVWPILYGATMWLTTAMSPAPSADPTQKMIFKLFPIIFTFTMAHFPVGLVIYYSWSNILTVLQQYVIMHRHKAENPIDDFINRLKGRNAPAKG